MNHLQLAALVVISASFAACQEAPVPASRTTAGEAQPSGESDVASVRAFLADAEKKFNTNDPNVFMPIFTDDAVIMVRGRRTSKVTMRFARSTQMPSTRSAWS